MPKQKQLSIIAFVGLTGSGKSTATHHLASQSTPRIAKTITAEIIDEINGLASAGQRLVVLDDIASWEQLVELKQAFPGRVSVVALFAPRAAIRKFSPNAIHQIEQSDRAILKASQKAEPIAAADYTITNDSSLEALYTQIDRVVEDIRTCHSGVWC